MPGMELSTSRVLHMFHHRSIFFWEVGGAFGSHLAVLWLLPVLYSELTSASAGDQGWASCMQGKFLQPCAISQPHSSFFFLNFVLEPQQAVLRAYSYPWH